MTDERKYQEYLSARQDVSIPELQQEFSCSYTEARRMLDRFRERRWVGSEAEGLRFPVNVFLLAPKEVPLPELVRICRGLRVNDLNNLERIALISGPLNPGLDPQRVEGETAEKLLSRGVIHKFGGMYFPSISRNSLKHLQRIHRGYDPDLAVDALGIPLVLCIIDTKIDLSKVLSLPIVPDNLRSYVEIQLAVHQVTGKAPRRRLRTLKGKETALRNHLLRALFSSLDYDGQEEYLAEARRCVAVLQEYPVVSSWFRDAARAVADYLETDMSDAAFRSVRSALLALSDEDIDKEDDEDDDQEVF